MKVLVIFLVLIGILTISAFPYVYAPPEPMPEDSFRFSDHVLTGKVVSSEVIPNPNEDTPQKKYHDTVVYEIQVLEWHKNPLENNTIIVYGEHYPNDVEPEPMWGVVEFEIGSTVYLYLDSTEDGLKFRDHASYLVKYSSENAPSPLKQFQLGVNIEHIQCKSNLVLLQKYDGSPACVTESTKLKLIERGWTSSPTTVTIYSNYEQDRDRTYTNPRNVVIDLEKNNSVKWVNYADYIVKVYDYENNSWSTGQIEPDMYDSVTFDNTGYYEFAVESTNDRHFGTIVVISDDTNSLPLEARMKMGMAIVSNDLGKNPVLIGVGTGDVNEGVKIDINQKELETRNDAESYYYDMYKEMIPFDVPITIEFTEPFRLLE